MSLASLRQETGPLHKALEEKLQLFQTVRTKSEYTQHLMRLHQWLHPLENRLRGFAVDLPIDWAKRVKSQWLEEDLTALGASLPPPTSPDLPPCDTPAQCLGILYVLEGSSLGAQIISRHYGERLGLKPDHGLRYFYGYGEETGLKWRAFLQCLEQNFSAHPEQSAEIIESACAAFRSYANFIPRNHG